MTRSRTTSAEALEPRRLFSAISGTTFNDRDSDAVYDNGPDLPVSAVVYLDANRNAVLDAGERSTTSSAVMGPAWGTYRFDDVGVGTFDVRVVPPANFVQTSPAANAASTVTITNPAFSVLGVNLGVRDTTQSSRLSGRAWRDDNRNGTKDSAETVLAGVTVWSDLDDDAVLDAGEQSTVTDAQGNFRLDVLNPKYTTTYRLRALAPPGLTQTTLGSTGGAHVVTIDAGNATFPGDVFGFADVTPPAVVRARLDVDAKPHVVRFELSEPSVNTAFTVAFALNVKRAGDDAALPVGTFRLQTNANGLLTYVVDPARVPDGLLPDGVYTATLAGNTLRDAAGNVRTTAHAFEFSVIRGDVNGDRRVDFADLVVVAQNYGLSGRTYTQGNVDYSADGRVEFADLVILAQRYGASLDVASPTVAASTSSSSVTTKRRAIARVMD